MTSLGFLSQLKRIGVQADDPQAVRLQKTLLVLSTAMMATAAILWGGIYIYYDEVLAAAIPLSYALASFLSLVVFAKRQHYELFRFSQLSLAILLPFLLAVTLGGFVPSSGVVLWSTVTPLGALLFADRRQAVVWMVVLAVLLVLAAWLQSQGLVGTSALPRCRRHELFRLEYSWFVRSCIRFDILFRG